jgi:GNAT superfamily N-acetyltransferase
MRASEIITEIHKMKPRDYEGEIWQPHEVPNNLKKLPGGSGLMYSINKGVGWYDYKVEIWDPDGVEEDPTYDSRLVGYLTLKKATTSPIPKALRVEEIAVDEEYRGIGIGQALYGIVLTIMKRPLVSGADQTPAGSRAWLTLSNIPGVEVKGYVQLELQQLRNSAQIDILMSKLGGQYIGNNKYGDPGFAFDVIPGNGELRPAVKTSLSRIYGSNDYVIGLYAVWTGN